MIMIDIPSLRRFCSKVTNRYYMYNYYSNCIIRKNQYITVLVDIE